jgi:hypothetical protein
MVCPGSYDQAYQIPEIIVMSAKVVGQPREQLRVDWRIGGAKIIHRPNQATR